MSKKMRLVIVLIVLEAVLAGIWWYLAKYGMDNPERIAVDFQETLGQTMGTAMGGLLGLGFVLFFVAARNDRKASNTPRR